MEHIFKFKEDTNYKNCPMIHLAIMVLQLFSQLMKTGHF